MNEKYLETIVQYLIKIANNNNSVPDKGITEKLDEVIAAVSNIKISAESVNLNTDEVEAKLDILNQSVIANRDNSDIVDKLIVLGTKLDSIKTAIDTTNNYWDSVSQRIPVNGYINPTHMMPVVAGDTTFDQNVVLCNITDNNITVSVTAADDTAAQSIVLTPGWNPVIVKAITGATANTLIYGW